MINIRQRELSPIYMHLSQDLRRLHPHRSELLFTEFLPRGYAMTALTSKSMRIPKAVRNQATLSKLLLACLITFQDDLADHPKHRNINVLRYLYRHLSHAGADRDFLFSSGELDLIRFSTSILNQLLTQVQKLPGHPHYRDLFEFDLDQFYNANRYSGLLARYPGLSNDTEQALFSPFNMGMTTAATIDLMSFRQEDFSITSDELTKVREASYLGQSAGRISNVLSTFGRELREGDVTNDAANLLASGRFETAEEAKSELLRRHTSLVSQVESLAGERDLIDLKKYAAGIRSLHQLHMSLEGVI